MAERMDDLACHLRVRGVSAHEAIVYSGTNSFTVGPAISFGGTAPNPAAVELLLGALAADLVCGYRTAAAERRIAVDGVEMALTGTVTDTLVYAGVIGAAGEPSVTAVHGVCYVESDAGHAALEALWHSCLKRSPTFNTLRRAVSVDIVWKLI